MPKPGADAAASLSASAASHAEVERSAEAFMMVNDPYASGQDAPGQPTDYL